MFIPFPRASEATLTKASLTPEVSSWTSGKLSLLRNKYCICWPRVVAAGRGYLLVVEAFLSAKRSTLSFKQRTQRHSSRRQPHNLIALPASGQSFKWVVIPSPSRSGSAPVSDGGYIQTGMRLSCFRKETNDISVTLLEAPPPIPTRHITMTHQKQ